ncbi:MAG: radical SAM family heme chaperone HemW [Tepidisphaeraceae bacterium]
MQHPADRPSVCPSELPRVEITGLYVHIPFCFHKCHYCDFYSITHQTESRMARFVELLLSEARMWGSESAGPTLRPRTVFLGGGTPTLLPLPEMHRLLQGLRAEFDFSALREWTVEANPATVSLEYLRMMRACGVDRISFGAQSFDRSELKTLERHHEPADVPEAIRLAAEAGFKRINLDLIFGIPGQSMDSWACSLNRAMSLGLDHLSCYNLTYEPNTPLAVKRRMNLLTPLGEDLELEMFRHTRRTLGDAGILPYEISNFARRGQECLHNLLYWSGGSYIGLGPAAASHIAGTRFRNRPHLGEWETGVCAGALPVVDVETPTPRQRAFEMIMLALRLSGGLNFSEYAGQTGSDARRMFAPQIDHFARLGLLNVDDQRMSLSDRGVELSDAIVSAFLETGENTTIRTLPV